MFGRSARCRPLVFASVSHDLYVIFVVPTVWVAGSRTVNAAPRSPAVSTPLCLRARPSGSCLHKSRCHVDLPVRLSRSPPSLLSTARTHSPGSGGQLKQKLQNTHLSVECFDHTWFYIPGLFCLEFAVRAEGRWLRHAAV